MAVHVHGQKGGKKERKTAPVPVERKETEFYLHVALKEMVSPPKLHSQ